MKHLSYLIIFILLLQVVTATITDYQAIYQVEGGKVQASITAKSDQSAAEFNLKLPKDAEILLANTDDKSILEDIIDNQISLNTSDFNSLELEYTSTAHIDKSSFLLDFIVPSDTDKVSIQLILPEGYTLEQPMEKGDKSLGSIFPKPTQATTDGHSMVFIWEWENLAKGHELPIYVKYNQDRTSIYIVAIAMAVFLLIILFFRKKPQKQQPGKKHLKEDEETIVNVLKQREDHRCEQGTLRVITGMPKASLSRLLTELEERKVIYKEKRGKKNLIFLRD